MAIRRASSVVSTFACRASASFVTRNRLRFILLLS
jgi:hypothetical protein